MSNDLKDIGKSGWAQRIIIGRHPSRTLTRIIIWIVVILLVRTYVLLPIRVEGVSMLPTYKEDGVNFVNCLAYVLHPPQRGDVVAICYTGRSVMLCKRIVALPGEVIAFRRGHIEINGEPLEEKYVKRDCNWERAAKALGPNEYYVVGDNRSMDFDQHVQGIAVRSKIVGKILL